MSDKEFLIFVVEDDEWYRKLLVHTLSLNPDYTVKAFENGESMLKHLKEKPQLITLDYRLPDYTGEELFDKIKGILINGSSSTSNFIENNGGRDYFGNSVSNSEKPNIGAYNGS